MTKQQLQRAIADLSAIHDQGHLANLQMDFAAECCAAGGLPDAEERAREVARRASGDNLKARDIARAAARFFNVSEVEAEAIAREVLVHDPWADIATDLIDYYRRRGQYAPQSDGQSGHVAKPVRRRKW